MLLMQKKKKKSFYIGLHVLLIVLI